MPASNPATNPTTAQAITPTTPVLDPELDAILRERLPADGVGASVAVVQGGLVRHRASYGLAVREWGIPPDAATVFGLGSLTKPFTALAVLRLVAAGKVRLDERLTMYLPDYHDPSETITIRNLLTHTSGIPNYVTQPDFWQAVSRREHTPSELRARFEGLPLDFAPGTRYRYSNSSYFLLALVIEAVSGKRYEEFVRDEILHPLGMNTATFFDGEHLIPHRAFGYRTANDHSGDPTTRPDVDAGFCQADYLSPTLLRGNGGMAASLDDLLAFDAALRGGRLLPAELWDEMVRPVRLNNGSERCYGLGWGLSTFRGRRAIHHAGGIPGYSSIYSYFPDDDLSLVMLANLSGFDCQDLARELAVAALNLSTPAQTPVVLPDEEIARMLGSYQNTPEQEARLERLDGRLLFSRDGRTNEVVPVDAGLLQAVDDPDVTMRFEGKAGDGYARVLVTVPFYWFVGERIE